MVLHFKRGIQRGDILVPRTIQDICLCVLSYSLHSLVDHRINIEQATPTIGQMCRTALATDESQLLKKILIFALGFCVAF